MTSTSWTRVMLTTAALVGIAAVAVPVAQRRYGQSPTYYGNVQYDGRFTFIRMSYRSGLSGFRRGGGGNAWSHDYPYGEHNFLKIMTSISNLNAHVDESSIMTFSDPEIFKFPLIYLVEPGYWYMSDTDVVTLRDYLSKGGFMIVDDFPWWAWQQFEGQMARVFPEKKWLKIGLEHPIFHSFFEVEPSMVPQAYPQLGGTPEFWALFEKNDENSRMLVIANYQNDLSEFWEYMERGFSPLPDTNESYKLGVNEFMYGITH